MYNGKVVKALLAAKGLKGTQLSNYLFGDPRRSLPPLCNEGVNPGVNEALRTGNRLAVLADVPSIAVDSSGYLVSRLSMTIRHDGIPAKAVSPLRVDYCLKQFLRFASIIASSISISQSSLSLSPEHRQR